MITTNSLLFIRLVFKIFPWITTTFFTTFVEKQLHHYFVDHQMSNRLSLTSVDKRGVKRNTKNTSDHWAIMQTLGNLSNSQFYTYIACESVYHSMHSLSTAWKFEAMNETKSMKWTSFLGSMEPCLTCFDYKRRFFKTIHCYGILSEMASYWTLSILFRYIKESWRM